MSAHGAFDALSVSTDAAAGIRSFPAHTTPQVEALPELDAAICACRACPRLVSWREQVASERRRAFRDEEYWGRPVAGFGPPDAALALVGLAPAAHGGNRTGRAFTGDPSGDVLFAALHALGLASRPDATSRADGMQLRGVRITMPVHCVPPENRPSTLERDTCRPWLVREVQLLAPSLRSVLALGAFGWQAAFPVLEQAGWLTPRPRPRFGHGARVRLRHRGNAGTLEVFGCYHPSRRNIATGRLTPEMLADVLREAAGSAGL